MASSRVCQSRELTAADTSEDAIDEDVMNCVKWSLNWPLVIVPYLNLNNHSNEDKKEKNTVPADIGSNEG